MLYVLLSLLASPVLYFLTAVNKKPEIKRILVVQTAKIGDLICTSPIFREIRKRYPQVHITALVNPVAVGVIKNNPNVDEIIQITATEAKGLAGKIKLVKVFHAGMFDAALILLPNLPNTLAAFWSLIPVRVSIYPDSAGITFKLCSIFNSHSIKHHAGELISKTYLNVLSALAIKTDDCSLEVYTSPTAKQVVTTFCLEKNIDNKLELIGISISCTNKLKELNQEQVAKLADMLLESYNAQVVFIGAKAEYEAAENIQSLMTGKAINSCGRFKLEELPALLKKLNLFIGVDTGIAYMAAATEIPIIVIAGPCDMRERPLGEKSEVVQKAFPCVPCSYTYTTQNSCQSGDRKCITSISVNEIMEAVKKITGIYD